MRASSAVHWNVGYAPCSVHVSIWSRSSPPVTRRSAPVSRSRTISTVLAPLRRMKASWVPARDTVGRTAPPPSVVTGSVRPVWRSSRAIWKMPAYTLRL